MILSPDLDQSYFPVNVLKFADPEKTEWHGKMSFGDQLS